MPVVGLGRRVLQPLAVDGTALSAMLVVMSEQKIPPFPTKADGEGEHELIGLSLSALDLIVPGAGLAAGTLFKRSVAEPLRQRQELFHQMIAERLQEALDRIAGLTPETLGENEEFLSVVAHASDIARRTHAHEKREALCNAAINTAVGNKLDDVVRGSFMNYVDMFSGLHIQVLRFLDDPPAFIPAGSHAGRQAAGSVRSIMRSVLTEDSEPDAALDRACRDLDQAGLIDGGSSLTAMMSSDGLRARRTTVAGQAFLRFISIPPEGKG